MILNMKFTYIAAWFLEIYSCMIFFNQGRFTIAAKHHVSIAEIYETEMVDIEKVG